LTVVAVSARVFSDATGAWTQLPILLTEEGPVLPLIDYLLMRSQERSLAWMRKVVQAVQLLLRFIEANEGEFPSIQHVLHAFDRRLYTGTVGENGLDPGGLYWKPMRIRTANMLLAALDHYCNWLADQRDIDPTRDMPISRYDERMRQAAWEHKRSRALLGHTWSQSPPARSPWTRLTRRAPKVSDAEDALSFPEPCFSELLLQGFARRGYGHHPDPAIRLNLRDCLITLLIHGAGFRISECFHLYVQDVRPDPRDSSIALVRIHHPSEGQAPEDWTDSHGEPVRANRAAYLAARFARRPRHQLLGAEAAGWKEPMLDGHYYMQAFWFPSELGRLFMHLWVMYLRQLVQVARPHPYAFVVLNGATTGKPLTLDGFKQSHARAIERIGLPVGKCHGTTPHAHRHAYGRRLMRAGVEPLYRKKALHHKALASQAVYTTPAIADMTRMLDAAMARLDELRDQGCAVKPVLGLSQLLQFGFEDIDPDGLLSGPDPKLLRSLPDDSGR
jgi:hypothetical protein